MTIEVPGVEKGVETIESDLPRRWRVRIGLKPADTGKTSAVRLNSLRKKSVSTPKTTTGAEARVDSVRFTRPRRGRSSTETSAL